MGLSGRTPRIDGKEFLRQARLISYPLFCTACKFD
jgi:hypothetical protein